MPVSSNPAKSENTRPPVKDEPWYRQPMVWMIITIPASSVIVGGIMLTLAITSFDGLVVDDYYKKGKEINMVLERDEVARSLNLSATVSFSKNNEVIIQLTHDNNLIESGVLQLNLVHRTRAGLDQTILMRLSSDGKYHGVIDNLANSDWLVQLETQEWRLTGTVSLPSADPIKLTAI